MSSPSIGIIIPSEFESKYLTTPHHVSGMGKIKATCAVYDLVAEDHDMLILAGFCGGLINCQIGDVIRPINIIEGDYNSNLEPYPNAIGFSNIGETIISQDKFLTSNPYGFLFKQKVAVDMESYAFAYTCNKLGIEYKIVKIVSDIVGENSEKDFLDSCKNLAPKLEECILAYLLASG